MRSGECFYLRHEQDRAEIAAITEIDLLCEESGHVHQTYKALDELIHIAERACLLAIAVVVGDVLVVLRLHNEAGDNAAVIGGLMLGT